MVAIITKYHGPTNTKGSRYSASAGTGRPRIYLSIDYALNSDGNHRKACEAYLERMGWKGGMLGGDPDDRSGRMFWVFANENLRAVSPLGKE